MLPGLEVFDFVYCITLRSILALNICIFFSAECGSCRTCAGEEGDIGGEGKNRTSIFFIKVYLIGMGAHLVCVTPT